MPIGGMLVAMALSADPPTFIALHTPDHVQVSLNAAEISSVRDPRAGHYGPGVKCVVVMANRSFIGVAEPCGVIHELLGAREHGPCTLVCGGTARP